MSRREWARLCRETGLSWMEGQRVIRPKLVEDRQRMNGVREIVMQVRLANKPYSGWDTIVEEIGVYLQAAGAERFPVMIDGRARRDLLGVRVFAEDLPETLIVKKWPKGRSSRYAATLGLMLGMRRAEVDLVNGRHAHGLVVGDTGEGKGVMTEMLVRQLADAGCEVVALNPKRSVEFEYADRVAWGLAECAAEIGAINDERVRRQNEMRERGDRHWLEHQGNVPTIVVLDEFNSLMDPSTQHSSTGKGYVKEAASAISMMASQSRSAGYVLIGISQRPLADSIGSWVRESFGWRALVGDADPSLAKMVLGEGQTDLARMLNGAPRGRALINGIVGQPDRFRLVQGAAHESQIVNVAA